MNAGKLAYLTVFGAWLLWGAFATDGSEDTEDTTVTVPIYGDNEWDALVAIAGDSVPEIMCPICLEDMDDCVQTSRGQLYHADCIRMSFATNGLKDPNTNLKCEPTLTAANFRLQREKNAWFAANRNQLNGAAAVVAADNLPLAVSDVVPMYERMEDSAVYRQFRAEAMWQLGVVKDVVPSVAFRNLGVDVKPPQFLRVTVDAPNAAVAMKSACNGRGVKCAKRNEDESVTVEIDVKCWNAYCDENGLGLRKLGLFYVFGGYHLSPLIYGAPLRIDFDSGCLKQM